MITRVRQYGKREPSRDAHKIYVLCEGSNDEPHYFGFFAGLSSNLNVIPIPSEKGETDPVKLSGLAESLFAKDGGRYNLDYSQGDRVWFVVDTDAWESEGKIAKLREFCKEKNGSSGSKNKSYSAWNVAQSNPSFEIWKYYHIYDKAPNVQEVELSASFKQFVDAKISGGFKNESDPVKLKSAIANASANYGTDSEGCLKLFATEVFLLGQEIYSFVSGELAKLLNKLR